MLVEERFEDGVRIEVDAEALVAVVTLDRAPVNALSPGAESVMRDAFDSFGDRTDVNCVVLTATGKHFCAGIDLRAQPTTEPTPMQRVLGNTSWLRMIDAIRDCGVPVIAAVNGSAVGAGIGLVWAADIIVASDKARFGLNELNIGVLGGTAAVTRMVGIFKARSMLFTADYVDAEEFHRLGAVEKVVSPDQLLPAALDIAARITPKSGLVLRLAKASVNRMERSLIDWDAAYQLEHSLPAEWSIEDGREARAAWMERRAPEWKWR
jgi:enoyl-CoA hydratase/carnithine racemase